MSTEKRSRKEIISYTMSRVKSRDTKIELLMRKELWRRGFRYRVNDKGVFGKPDICFRRYKLAIFCDSEFWHGKDWEKRKNDFKSNKKFWQKKIEANIARDLKVNKYLHDSGWRVLRFWGKDIIKDPAACVDKIVTVLQELDKAE